MNAVREINRINQRELELGVAGKGSWHDEYKDSAYVFVGGLPYDLTEGDVITIFSQWGEIVNINLSRDKTTGKTKGFGFVMFEDQRSTVLAVDNMNGTQVLGRTIRVDHCRKYNQPGSKNEEGEHVAPEEPTYNAMPPVIEGSESESSESQKGDDLDEEDPMAAFIRAEKKKEKSSKKAITNGKDKKRKHHEGETREGRRARIEAKRAKRAERGDQRAKGETVEVKEGRSERGGRRRDDVRPRRYDRDGEYVKGREDDGRDRGGEGYRRRDDRSRRSEDRSREIEDGRGKDERRGDRSWSHSDDRYESPREDRRGRGN